MTFWEVVGAAVIGTLLIYVLALIFILGTAWILRKVMEMGNQ